MTLETGDVYREGTVILENGAALLAAADIHAGQKGEEFALAKTISLCEWCIRIAERLLASCEVRVTSLDAFEAFAVRLRAQERVLQDA